MAGIYIHIPFCKQACNYCDFHFSINHELKEKVTVAILKEMELQKNYLSSEPIQSIYFGGGTPSLLSKQELQQIFNRLHQLFNIENSAEITLEANPDDLTAEKIAELQSCGINRLSIGIQSFYNKDLRWMNRVHTAEQAESAVKLSQDMGFNNISIDLIYGLPHSTTDEWEENLNKAFELNIQHLSCYSLTVEPRTPLAAFIKKGKVQDLKEELTATQFELLMKTAYENGWIHYEISNFCRENYYSKHNASYWTGEKYLGLGPSAHSFNGLTRQWNISNNHKYLIALKDEKVPFKVESLSITQQFNEYIITSLRTMWGTDLEKIKNRFNATYSNEVILKAKKFENSGSLLCSDKKISLTNKGKLLADRIILELMEHEG
ncbi:MAG: radical SAM family heme chaperone HemW [Chitinophagales bacterium]|nr:radical SAM family heme chaperone HemW [Chitinophagales bacterium]